MSAYAATQIAKIQAQLDKVKEAEASKVMDAYRKRLNMRMGKWQNQIFNSAG